MVAAVVLALTRSGGRASLPTETTTHGACLACRQQVDVVRAVGAGAPYECPGCGERAVYKLFYCPKCKIAFVPNLFRDEFSEFPKTPPIPSCPKCGNNRLQLYNPEKPDQPLEEELILPAWPQ